MQQWEEISCIFTYDTKSIISRILNGVMHASDSYTREATVDEVYSSQAYLPFYERVCLSGVEQND